MAENKNQKEETVVVKKLTYTVSIREVIKGMASTPPQKMIYSGIRENSVGVVFGRSKSGKTTFCENLGMCIAAGIGHYLGKPIKVENKKVLFISLEEFCEGRIARNQKQAKKLSAQVGNDDWMDNYVVADCDIIRYVNSDKDWKVIQAEIEKHKPDIVFIDSMSRLHGGDNIEESPVGYRVMKNLKVMANETGSTFVIIHHTPKMQPSEPLDLFSMAGSRVLSQEVDFAIGINKTADKKTYIKDVAFRYADDSAEKVTVVKMDADQWLEFVGYEDEAKLLSSFDGRRDDANKELILNFFETHTTADKRVFTAKEITDAFVATGKMSKQTVFNQLGSLVSAGKITKAGTGEYSLVS